jgi:hypothetical protein
VTGGEPLDERYFAWLYGMIGTRTTRNPARNYWRIAKQLYTKEFHYFVPNDDNRAEDGRLLRDEFLHEVSSSEWRGLVEEWYSLPCSFLEMLIALSRRASYEAFDDGSNSVGDWFWRIVKNLGLDIYNDSVRGPSREQDIDAVLEVVIDRSYRPDGDGGMFPLLDPATDQRTTEIWYQMAAYLLENSDERLLS